MYDTVYSTLLNRYEQYERRNGFKHNRRCIDGSITGCNKCVGYCQYTEHPGFLTREQRTQHNCIEKGCSYYIPKQKNEDNGSDRVLDISSLILREVQNNISTNEEIRIMRVENTAFKQYSAYYITITNECNFEACSSQIQNEFGVNLKFVKLNYDFDKCIALLYAYLGEAV